MSEKTTKSYKNVHVAADIETGVTSAKTPAKIADRIAVAVVVLGIVAAIQIASFFVEPFIMPPPSAILDSLVRIVTTEYAHMLATLLRLICAVIFAMAVGTLIGIIMGTVNAVRPYLRALVIIDTGIPALSWILIAVFWFREPEYRIFFILAVILIPFYALNTHEGIRAMSKEWIEMCESFRPSRWQSLRFLVLPQVVPYVIMTTKSIFGYATRMVIFAELIGATVGVGAQMGFAQATFNMDAVLAWTVLLVTLNLLVQAAISIAEKRILHWRPEIEVR